MDSRTEVGVEDDGTLVQGNERISRRRQSKQTKEYYILCAIRWVINVALLIFLVTYTG